MENKNTNIHKTSIMEKTSITPWKKPNSKKSFLIYILSWTGFLMIPLTTLYDEYIDWPKLTGQKNQLSL